MEKYDYKRAITDDLKDWIVNNTDIMETSIEDGLSDDIFNWIYDETWAEDEITGNGIFGYAPASKCEEYLAGNLHLALEALDSFGASFKDLLPKNNDELIRYLDCTIRCYLLMDCIYTAMEELKNEMGRLSK